MVEQCEHAAHNKYTLRVTGVFLESITARGSCYKLYVPVAGDSRSEWDRSRKGIVEELGQEGGVSGCLSVVTPDMKNQVQDELVTSSGTIV